MGLYSIIISLFLILNVTPKDSIRIKKVANLSDTLESHEIFEPTDVTLGDKGNIYIFDNGKKEIHVFSENFDHRYSFGSQGPGPGEFDRKVTEILLPHGGNLVALEKWERMVHYFTRSGKYIDSFFIQKNPPIWVHLRQIVVLASRSTLRLTKMDMYISQTEYGTIVEIGYLFSIVQVIL